MSLKKIPARQETSPESLTQIFQHNQTKGKKGIGFVPSNRSKGPVMVLSRWSRLVWRQVWKLLFHKNGICLWLAVVNFDSLPLFFPSLQKFRRSLLAKLRQETSLPTRRKHHNLGYRKTHGRLWYASDCMWGLCIARPFSCFLYDYSGVYSIVIWDNRDVIIFILVAPVSFKAVI